MPTRFDEIAQQYEKAHALYPDARTDAKEVLRLLDIKGNETILETTCGTGFLTAQIIPLLQSGKIISHDISAEMVAFARKKVERLGARNARFYLTCDMTLPALPDASVDKAVCLGGFHHVEEPVKLFRSVCRILRPGGIFVVGDFADRSPVQNYFDEQIDKLTDTGHQGLFLSVSQMKNFARFSGLEAVSVERKDPPFLFKTKRDIGIFYGLVHALKQTPEETLRDIEQYLGVEKRENMFAVPMGYVYAKYRNGGGR